LRLLQDEARVWGAAYELVGKPMIVEALEHLGVRECLLGGYISVMTPFYERPSPSNPSPPQISVLMFTATESNELFLGPTDSLDELAAQIVSCRGPCGNNVQYVVQLANYMREHIPEEHDAHLFGLVERIEAQCAEREMNIEELVNEVIEAGKTTEHECPKCKVLCTEYAFCQACRAETIQDELPEAAETEDDAFAVEPTYPKRRYSVSQRRRSSVSQLRRSSILASLPMEKRRRRSSLLEILQDEAAKQSVHEAAK
jgi:cation transport regulator ChaC